VDTGVLKIVGQVAGIGGIAFGVVLLVFRDVIRKNIFPTLTKEQSYRLIRLIVLLTFVIAALGILAWVYTSSAAPIALGGPDRGFIRAIPADQIPDEFISGSSRDPLQITDLRYDKEKGQLDVRVRNNSTETTIVSRIYFTFGYDYKPGANLDPSGTHDLQPDANEMKRASEQRRPFEFKKGFEVSYKIPPKDADRYLFNFRIDKSNLYFPTSKYGGDYQLAITLLYNGGEETGTVVSLDDLLNNSWRNLRPWHLPSPSPNPIP
jgi:hypothetical protein